MRLKKCVFFPFPPVLSANRKSNFDATTTKTGNANVLNRKRKYFRAHKSPTRSSSQTRITMAVEKKKIITKNTHNASRMKPASLP